MRYIKNNDAYNFIYKTFKKIGVNEFSAVSTAKGVTEASLRGVDSHGIRLFKHYLNCYIEGRKNKKPKFKINKKFPCLISLDADHASGLAAGMKAIEKNIAITNRYGVCATSVYNSSHPGALSSIALRAAEKGLICIAFANADNLILSHNGKRSYFGTNPICIAAPRDKNEPFCLDMATSKISWNKLKMIKNSNKKIDNYIASDVFGKSTTNPFKAKSLFPIGEYKGFGLASAIEMLCGIYSGMPFGRQIFKMFEVPLSTKRYLSQFYITLRCDGVIEQKKFISSLKKMSKEIRGEPSLKNKKVIMPNDPQILTSKIRLKKGIPVDQNLYNDFISISKKYSIKLKFI